MPESINATQAIPAEPTAAESRCVHCAAFLNSLPDAARFCPRCGSDLMSDKLRASNSTRPWMINPILGSSAILVGYANALYSLGRRYESGGGLARNRNEAMRVLSQSRPPWKSLRDGTPAERLAGTSAAPAWDARRAADPGLVDR
jgi:TPR repeat protein